MPGPVGPDRVRILSCSEPKTGIQRFARLVHQVTSGWAARRLALRR